MYVTYALAVISVSFAVFFGVKSKKRAYDADTAKKAETITRLEDKMDSLTKSLSDFANEIKLEIRDMRKNFDEVKAQGFNTLHILPIHPTGKTG